MKRTAKPEDRPVGRQYPHQPAIAPWQPDAARAVGDDIPKTPAVEDKTQPAPGRPVGKGARSSKGGEKE